MATFDRHYNYLSRQSLHLPVPVTALQQVFTTIFTSRIRIRRLTKQIIGEIQPFAGPRLRNSQGHTLFDSQCIFFCLFRIECHLVDYSDSKTSKINPPKELDWGSPNSRQSLHLPVPVSVLQPVFTVIFTSHIQGDHNLF